MLGSINSIDDFIGNETEISKVTGWLNQFFHDKRETTKKYAIISGDSGNGKTALIEFLAKEFKVPILIGISSDINSKDTLNDFKKTLNLMTITGDIKRKIILIDDIDEFPNSPKKYFLRNQMMKNVLTISDQPVIYTTRNPHKLPKYFTDTKYCITCHLKKPLHSEMLKLLNKLCKEYKFNFTKSQLEHIVKTAPSVRSAIMSLFSDDVSSVLENQISIFAKFKMLKENKLSVPLNSYEIKILAHNCKDIDDLLYVTKLSINADMNYNREINPKLLNVGLKLPGRIEFFSVKNQKYELNEEEEKIAKAIHVSAKTFKQEFKHLTIEEKKKEKDVTKRQEKPIFQSLASFY